MPISDEAFRKPKFVKYKPEYPFSDNKKAKYYATTEVDFRNYRLGVFPQQGYNPHLNQAVVRKININTENFTLPPY